MNKGLPYKNNTFCYEDGKLSKGQKISEKTKEAYVERGKKVSKPIIHVETGIEYSSCSIACKELGLNSGQLSLHLNGKRPSAKGQRFKFKNKN